MVEVKTDGVPTPHMGSWKKPESTVKKPRYAMKNSCSIPDAELMRLHIQEKKTAAELARMTGETALFMRAKLRSDNMKNCYRNNFRPRKRELDEKELLLRYELGYSPREIGDFFGVSAPTIRARLKALGRRRDYKTSVQYLKGKIAHGLKSPAELKKFGFRKHRKKRKGLLEW